MVGAVAQAGVILSSPKGLARSPKLGLVAMTTPERSQSLPGGWNRNAPTAALNGR